MTELACRIAALAERGVDATWIRNPALQVAFFEGAERALLDGPDTYNVPRPAGFTRLQWRRRQAWWMRGFFAAWDALTAPPGAPR